VSSGGSIMNNLNDATKVWFCCNCGMLVRGYLNNKNKHKALCSRCGIVMIRTERSRRHYSMEIYSSKKKEEYKSNG